MQCGEGSNTNANKMLSEIYRVLAANGVYIMITFGYKEQRLQYLEKAELDWGITMEELPNGSIVLSGRHDSRKPTYFLSNLII